MKYITWIGALAAAALLGLSATAQAATGFQAQASSNVTGSDYNELDGVTDIGATNDAAVGFYQLSGQTIFHAFGEHWNGRTWAVITVPAPAGDDTRLHAVTAATVDGLWAVGSDANHSLIEQSSTGGVGWSLVASPAGEPAGSVLDSVSAVSATDVWAVGHAGSHTLIENWNGTAWSVVPGAPVSGSLTGVAGSSPSDVWAVGQSGSQPLVEHWNGTAWSVVTQPVNGAGSLNSVAVISSTDAWAVGDSGSQQVIENWNGTAWTVVPSPSVTGTLAGVSTIGSSDVWAVGSSASQTLAEHWDGTAWQIVPSANPGPGTNVLNSLARTSPGGPLRAVGLSAGGTPPTATLVETTVG
jgi:hypothetical protein